MQVTGLHLAILATMCLLTIEGIPLEGINSIDLSKIQGKILHFFKNDNWRSLLLISFPTSME